MEIIVPFSIRKRELNGVVDGEAKKIFEKLKERPQLAATMMKKNLISVIKNRILQRRKMFLYHVLVVRDQRFLLEIQRNHKLLKRRSKSQLNLNALSQLMVQKTLLLI
jgi:hypothetical protein